MEKLLSHLERELDLLRRGSLACSGQNDPVQDLRRQLSGQASADLPPGCVPKQPAALRDAQTMKRPDDDSEQFTQALLSVLYPNYLRPFPSCAIAHIDFSAAADMLGAAATIARGSMLKAPQSDGVACQFRTAYDVCVSPVSLTDVRFHPQIEPPGAVCPPPRGSAAISMVIDRLQPGPGGQPRLRVYIDGEASFCATLRDTLFMRTVCAYVERPGMRQWSLLDKVPLMPVGFAGQDALIPFRPGEHAAYRILTEYFAFPEKFNFFDLDLTTLVPYLPPGGTRLILHLALAGLGDDPDSAHRLAKLSSKHLVLGCTPVVNLFRHSASPIKLTDTASHYDLVLPAGQEMYSIDAVHMLGEGEGSGRTEFHPFYALRHGQGRAAKKGYWKVHGDEAAGPRSGCARKIAFVDRDCNPLREETGTVSVEVTCSNGDLAATLHCGAAEGDLSAQEGGAGYPIRLLRQPGVALRFPCGQGNHWRLIAHLSQNHHVLSRFGLEALVEMLALHDLPRSALSQRQIGAIAALEHSSATTRLRDRQGMALVHGIDVRMTLDETAFVGSGVHVFAQVIGYVLGLYIQLNHYIQLTVIAEKTGRELLRFPPATAT